MSNNRWFTSFSRSVLPNYNSLTRHCKLGPTFSSAQCSGYTQFVLKLDKCYVLVCMNIYVHYGTTKASLIHLTKYLANYLARYKIRVNCISPGAFPSKTNSKNKKFIKNLKKKIPLARIGKPEDLTGIIEFLISSKSSYITGQNIIVDGGWTLQWKKKLWL